MLRDGIKWFLQHAQIAEGGDAGGGAAAGGAAAGATGAAAGGAAAGDGEGSLLSQAAGGGAAAAAGGAAAANADGTTTITIDEKTGRPSNVPEKFWDPEAKAVRTDAVLKSYTELESRVGVTPANADDYKADTVFEDFKKTSGVDIPPMDDELSKQFRGEAHKLGLSQKQYEGVMRQYLGSIHNVMSTAFDVKMTQGKAEISKVWKTEAEQTRNIGFAAKAYMTYAPEALRNKQTMDMIGSNPIVLQVLANIGKELKEDKPAAGDLPAIGNDIKALRNSEAYWKKQHPDHQATVERVAALYKAQAEAKRLAGG